MIYGFAPHHYDIICILEKGYTPYAIFFYKKMYWGGNPRSTPTCQISSFWVKKSGLRPQKIAKNRNFWYKFFPKKKLEGSTEKVEYRCTSTNLPLCNETIIVLKVTLLHSVSIITNFVIPKRDQKNRHTDKNITFSSSAGARPTIPISKYGGDRCIEEGL